MKYVKWIVVVIFIGMLLLMERYDKLFQAYGMTKSLETQFGYSSSDVYSTFQTLGSSGRKLFIQYFFVDYIFILCYGAIQIFILKWVLGERFKETTLKYIILNPIVGCTCDIVENALFTFLMVQMPNEHFMIVSGASYATRIKLIAYAVGFISIGTIGILRLVANLINRNKNTHNRLKGV